MSGEFSVFTFPFSVCHTPSALRARPPNLGGQSGWTLETLNLKRRYFIFMIRSPTRFALPNVAMGIATLRGHRMTFGHSSKDPLRPLT